MTNRAPTSFEDTLVEPAPPSGLAPALLGLWHGLRGDWEAAHRIVQDADDRDSAWVHAWLHREEGDLANAGYWYRRAGRPVADGPTRAEALAIARALDVAIGPPA